MRDAVPRVTQMALGRLLLALTVLGALVAACQERRPTPTPPPPTRVPTATPSVQKVLDEGLFSVTLDGRLLGNETIRVSQVEKDRVLVVSELQRYGEYTATERRVLVFNLSYTPMQYDLERNAGGLRSLWVAQRREGAFDILNNNLGWFGPVVAGVSPAPDALIENAPSALPYALLALRYTPTVAERPLMLRALDVLEDLPTGHALTVTVAADRKGAVIGTLALDGQLEGGPNPRFTMWIRPGSRQLYSVEYSNYRFGIWPTRWDRTLRSGGKLVIQRVSKLPDAPTITAAATPPATPPAAAQVRREKVELKRGNQTQDAGTLTLPPGTGPFPCIVLPPSDDIATRWDAGGAFAQRGWAAFTYDRAGIGDRPGDVAVRSLNWQVQYALVAADLMRQRADIDPKRIVYLGIGEAGAIGAAALGAANSPYAAAVLGSCAAVGPMLPGLVQARIRGALAPAYGWDPARIQAYEAVSLRRWQQLLFERQQETVLLGRRIPLTGLREWADWDMLEALAKVKQPVLLLHGGKDAWTPVAGARALADALQARGVKNVTLRVFDALGEDLGRGDALLAGAGPLAAEVIEAVVAWVEGVKP